MQKTITAINGMDNVTGGGYSKGVLTPGLVVNAVINSQGQVDIREGSDLHITLAGAHSFWVGSDTVFVANLTTLRTVDLAAKTTTQIASIPGGKRRFYYVELGPLVYISNGNWLGVYDDGSIRTWGQIITDMDALTWVRETNGSRLFLADAEGNPTATLKPHDFVHIPKPMDFIVFAHGRIWGVRDNKLLYSDAMSPEWFQDDKNQFEFDDVPNMVAASDGGMFIGFEDYTINLLGRDPKEMQSFKKLNGVIANTLEYVSDFKELGYNIPMWGSKSGVMAGLPDGQIVEVTGGKVRYDATAGISSFFRYHKGEPMFGMFFTFPATNLNGDPDTHEWIKDIYKLTN